MEIAKDQADVVYGKRRRRAGESLFKRMSASAFYRFINIFSGIKIPEDTGDFRLMRRRVLDIFLAMPERHRFVRGMIAWIGLKQVAFLYNREPRFAGKTQYTLAKMIQFSIDAITSFSTKPLRFCFYLACFGIVLFTCVSVWVFWILVQGKTVPGWASIVLLLLLTSIIHLFTMGVIGEYVGRIFEEVKNRPLYSISEIRKHTC